jgi:hypothetical protein
MSYIDEIRENHLSRKEELTQERNELKNVMSVLKDTLEKKASKNLEIEKELEKINNLLLYYSNRVAE